ncbi:hypothetical protein [Celeribacter baekdonensis]|jgi:hypothetical protein|uniref:Uncharacterized protein n=1 Tax=Celeribacter baekdonensis TaxID=875171 RepID=A0A2R4M4I5_9RHOB|nr:hypothetical protein [Celeribacter baekdonensis]AVW92085.1 hypothetical protein DA792_14170 [Celeribacter baekdonensis]|tara:strand:- start:78378 stop:78725 length:348 start_codon:yes stop_codon:yes gene_type:complete
MARRSKEEVLDEFHKLYDCLDAFLSCHDTLLSKANAQFRRKHVVTREQMLNWFENGTHSPSQIVSGVLSGLSDCKETVADLAKYDPDQEKRFRDAYLRRRGKSFEDDIALARYSK